jgi:putative flippase GtrA
MIKLFNKLILIVKNNQELKFLFVGAYNTLFSFVVGNLCFYFIDLPYLVNMIIIYHISILNSYFCYKIFIFKTKGNVVRELVKANMTYLTTLMINLLLMFIAVKVLNFNKMLAFNIVSIIVVAITYFMHKNFTFKTVSVIGKI